MNLADKILNVLESEKFNKWYNHGRFDAYITGEEFCPNKERILQDIKKMFNIEEI